MALKAGYYGVKKSIIDIVKSLGSLVLVKDIGDGLDYDEETGELSSDIKSIGDGLELDENGELNALAKGTNYSFTEFDTGETWINGEPIKGRVYKVKANELELGTVTSNNVKGHIFTDLGVDDYEAVWVDISKSFIILGTRSESPYVTPLVYPTSNSYVRVNVQQAASINNGKITVYFDATYSTGVLSQVSGENYIVVTLLYVEKSS